MTTPQQLPSTMRAAVYHGPGDIRIEEVRGPADPAADELVLRVRRAAVCGTDATEYSSGPKLIPLHAPHPHSGHRGPLVLGHEFVGEVVAAGAGVRGFNLGDRVVTGAGISCGECEWCRAGRTNLCARYFTLGLNAHGGLADYALTPARICVRVPDGCSDDAAALGQPLAVALHALRRGRLGPTDSLAVIGAGGIGSLAVAAASARQVDPVIAVDVDAARLEVARELGATDVVDASGGDAAAVLIELTGGDGPHVILEASGSPHGPTIALRAVRRGGTVVLVGLQGAPRELDLFSMTMREVELTSALAHVCADDLPEALEILAATDLAAKLIDRVVPLSDVAASIAGLAAHEVEGKVVVDLLGA